MEEQRRGDSMADKSVSNDQFRSQHASEELGDIIEVSGHIKWFDVAKGYGFIVPDQPGLNDILLHVTSLRRDGFQTALEGARIVCEVRQGERGLQCFRVLSMIRLLPFIRRRCRRSVPMSPSRRRAGLSA
jgi:CspA family cold shock protein